ncbi:estrogen-related receptor gamma isoform X2 [Hyalella azteca]|uniref:Estrogen-related receptor gamma isoform X2 n=1 Tax=Hyalella azteca TaxID=294128 RepID=A0A8B7PFV1_HYAAZ|nr:estrogen-related receptor gamma isoform X2 [Hyalella azteca]
MEALCREILAREVLPSADPSGPHQRSIHEPSSLPRSLVDTFSFNASAPIAFGKYGGGESGGCHARSLDEGPPNFCSRMEHDDVPSTRRFTKLENDDLSYTHAVNPNEITSDRIRKKNPRINGDLNSERHYSNSLDFTKMDHDVIEPNQTNSYEMLDHEDALYLRFTSDSPEFSSSLTAVGGATPHSTNGPSGLHAFKDGLPDDDLRNDSMDSSSLRLDAADSMMRIMGGGSGAGGTGVGGSGGATMMSVEETGIKQEDGMFSGLAANGGGGILSSAPATPTTQLIHHHLQSSGHSPGGRLHVNSTGGGPLASTPDGRNRAPSCSSPSGRYSPSTTALPSELDYSECGDELPSSSPRFKVFRESPSSPPSPDRHFCSSTTSLAGDSSINQPEEEDAPRRMCLVCGDVASGFHYGVASCEACKAFFKRTIQGNIEYTCPANKDCEINKKRRKACQACRFTKCLSVGMLKEGVRLDRVRGGRQKYRRTSETPFSTPTMGNRRCLDDLKILSALRSCEPECINALSDLPGDMADLSLVGTLADFYDRELVATIGWAKQVPGFSDIVLDDQMRLLQSTWGEILTLGLAFRSMSTGGTRLHFAADLTIDENSAREWQALELYNQVLAVVERFEQVNLQHDEFLVLKALVLTNSDVRLQDTVPLQNLRTQFLQTLLQVVESIRNHDITQHFNSLLLCLPALRSADFALRRFWLSIRHQETVPMNKLFCEMLESQMR